MTHQQPKKEIDLSEYVPKIALPGTGQRANIALAGPSGAGKSMTALRLMHALLDMDTEAIKKMSQEEYIAYATPPRIMVVDTERGAARKYANWKRFGFAFHVSEPRSFLHSKLRESIKKYREEGYQGLIIDSFSHFWIGKDGILAVKDALSDRAGGAITAWREINPLERLLYDELLSSGMHLICTMRAKMEYQVAPGADGRVGMQKIGLGPVQRPDIEYEFDIMGDIDMNHTISFRSSRADALNEVTFTKPTGREIAAIINDWLNPEQ